MKNVLRGISLVLLFPLILAFCACNPIINNMSSGKVDAVYYETVTIQDGSNSETATSDDESGNESITDSSNTIAHNSSDINSQQKNETPSEKDNNSTTSEVVNPNASAAPQVTLCSQVASNIYVVGGVCSLNTEYINIGGIGVKTDKIIPAKAQSNSYFIAQVQIDYYTTIEIQGKEKGKDLSTKIKKFVTTNTGMKNLMTDNEYMPVFGTDSRMHFYSAILSYTACDFVDSDIKDFAKYNIGETVDAAKSVGAEVIYLVVPSSAAVYPETVPSEYKAASGETLYKAFNSVATAKGAKVIYPIDTMKSHKNDGDGYKIYSHTDSHWTTYGAYFGVYELMNYISGKYPSAKPRTVADMGFYVTELYGGDALFSFGSTSGFENRNLADSNNGITTNTKIKELTTLYSRVMPTSTLNQITRGGKSIYLNKANESKATVKNSSDSTLPTAIVVRDSFGRTAYDMINDRFSRVTWLDEGDYASTVNAIYENEPNYVIYIVSERNLLEVMLNQKDIDLCKYAK